MGLFLVILFNPSPSLTNLSNHCLTAIMDVDVLNGHLLLALSSVPIQGL